MGGKHFAGNDPVIVSLAQKYQKTPAQLILRFLLQQGVAVIPKSATKSRIIENLNIFNFTIEKDDIQQLISLDKNKRIIEFKAMRSHKYYPFNVPF